MDWLDVVILLVLAFFGYTGYRRGFLAGLIELLGIVVSVAIPFLLYVPVGHLLERFGVSRLYSGAIGFLILWLITLNLYFFGARRLYGRVPLEVHRAPLNSSLGILPGIIRGVIVVAVVLTVISMPPIQLVSQAAVDHSLVAPVLVDGTMTVATRASDIFGEAVHNAFGFMTIKPEGNEIVSLRFKVEHPVVDPKAEEEMLRMLNDERAKHGLRPVMMDPVLREVARKHSIDMFKRGYFGHNTPEGVTPFRRMQDGGAHFRMAGENLALAPTVRLAHSGLMKSPGHRANILRPQFRRVGIGAASGGRYGIMFTQDFTD